MRATATIYQNPLLQSSGLPEFADIKPEQVEPAFNYLLAELEKQLAALGANIQPTWSGLVEPLEKLTERLNWSWGILNHLMGVKNDVSIEGWITGVGSIATTHFLTENISNQYQSIKSC
jgi:oligopeptidase A